MPGIRDWAVTAPSDDAYFPEGQSPSSVNNGARRIKDDVREWYNDAQWIEYGVGTSPGNGNTSYTVTYVSSTSFRVASGNATAAYQSGRRLKMVGTNSGTIYGNIVTASYNSPGNYTEIIVTWTSGAMASESGLRVWLGALTPVNTSFPPGALTGQNVEMGGGQINSPRFGNYSQTCPTLSIASGFVSWDLTAGNTAYLLLTENVTSFEIIGWAASPYTSSASLWVQQNGSGGWAMSGWPSAIAWLGGSTPTNTTAANSVDIFVFQTIDGGANIIGSAGQGALFASPIRA